MTRGSSTARTGPAGELVVPARLFCDATPGLGTEGELVLSGSRVVFEAGDAITELPVAGLLARAGGYDDRTLFLSHPSQPGIEITTVDPAAFAAPAIAALPSLGSSLRSHRASRRRFWGFVAAAVMLALLVAVVAVLGFGYGLERIRELIGAAAPGGQP